ncbi:MAG: UDP-N-acetylmuramoyl-L-alanyl-D-glutamate--2,6-diaminopimelate ligase [Glaciecola sp.]
MSSSVADLVAYLPGARLHAPAGAADPALTMLVDATHDSRAVGPDMLFCAMVGANADGHDHAADAVRAGSTALLVQRPLPHPVAQIVVPDTRAAAGPAAALVHGEPTLELLVVGITGTNGKTTTSYLLEHAFAWAGLGTGVIGTIEARVHGEALKGVRTTPEGTDLQRLMRKMLDRGVDAVAMEASSHGLAMHRVDGIAFDAAVHLNLTQDHLDFHADMAEYAAAKERLFSLAPVGVICIEDQWSRRLAQRVTIPVVTFGRPQRCGAMRPDWALLDVVTGADGTSFTMHAGDQDVRVHTQLVGDVNGVNAAAAWLAARAVGIDELSAAEGIAQCPGVPGRLESVPNEAGMTVLVDYAHTADAIGQAIRIVRGIAGSGRVLVVVGCGGGRDRAKRGPMGAAAADADVAILTSDNPRSEDPESILDEMVAGALDASGPAQVLREVDRETAIALAISKARPGDLVLIAGKGHETGQEFAHATVPFDDREVAARLLRQGRDA